MTSRRDQHEHGQDDQWRVPDTGYPAVVAQRSAWHRVDLALRIVGGVVAVWGSLVAAALEAFLVPLRFGGVRVPICLLMAVVGNILFMRFARSVTGNRFVALLPGLAWFVVTIVLSSQTTEGDTVLLGGDWVPLALLLVGAASVAVGAYLSVAPRRRDGQPSVTGHRSMGDG